MNGSKRWKLIWPFVLLAAVVLAFELLDGVLTYVRGGDSINYVLLAKALATGRGFTDINLPGAPPHTQYPPLFPLMLAPFYYLGAGFIWMKLLVAATGVAAVYMAKRYFEEAAGTAVAVVVAVLVATNFYFLFFERELLTEVPYAFLAITALFTFRRYCREGSPGWYYAVMPAVLAAAYFTRMIGITLLAACALALLLEALRPGADRKGMLGRLVVLAAAGGLPFVAWSVRNGLHASGTSTYQAIFMRSDYYSVDSGVLAAGGLAARFAKNVGYYADALPKALLTSAAFKDSLPPLALKAAMLVILALVLVGLAYELWRRRGGVAELYFVIYFSLLTVWPVYGTGDARRYVVPMLPFVYYYLLAGIRVVAGPARAVATPGPPALKRAAAAAVVFFLVMNLVQAGPLVRPGQAAGRLKAAASGLASGLDRDRLALTPETLAIDHFREDVPCYSSYMLAALALKDAIGPEEVVMARKPELVALITGGYAVRLPFTRDFSAVERFIRESSVDYVVVDSCWREGGQYLVPFVNANPESFEVMGKVAEGTVLLKYTGARMGP